jgi:hypothetical protein
MARKNPKIRRVGSLAAGPSHFKHVTKGLSLAKMLSTYGLTRADYLRVKRLAMGSLNGQAVPRR